MKGLYRVKCPADTFRLARAEECFPIINRGKLWYDTLTPIQLGELKAWYHAWLDAPETLVYPKRPAWLNDKVSEEEILL